MPVQLLVPVLLALKTPALASDAAILGVADICTHVVMGGAGVAGIRMGGHVSALRKYKGVAGLSPEYVLNGTAGVTVPATFVKSRYVPFWVI